MFFPCYFVPHPYFFEIASPCREMRLMLVLVGRVKEKLLEDGLLESTFVTKRG